MWDQGSGRSPCSGSCVHSPVSWVSRSCRGSHRSGIWPLDLWITMKFPSLSAEAAAADHCQRSSGDILQGAIPSSGMVVSSSTMYRRPRWNQLLSWILLAPTSLDRVSFYFEWLLFSALTHEYYEWHHESSFTKVHWNEDVCTPLIVTATKIRSVVLTTIVA